MNQLANIQPSPPVPGNASCVVSLLKETYIRYPRLKQVEADLEKLYTFGSLAGPLATSSSIYMLTGTAGCGKTTILKHFRDSHPATVGGPEDDQRPVLYVEVPPNATRKGLANAILDALEFHQRPHNITENKLFALVLHHLREQRVRMLMLDESHGFVDRRSRLFNYDGAEWLKSLLNARLCAIVVAGCPDAELVYAYNDQLERRSYGSRRLEPFRYSSGSDWQVFSALAQNLLGRAPGGQPLEADMTSACMALHLVSDGHLGRLVDFLSFTFINVIEGNHASLDAALIETAEQRRPRRSGSWMNPFSMGEGELVQALEAAEKARDSGSDYESEPTSRLRRGRRGPTQADIGC